MKLTILPTGLLMIERAGLKGLFSTTGEHVGGFTNDAFARLAGYAAAGMVREGWH